LGLYETAADIGRFVKFNLERDVEEMQSRAGNSHPSMIDERQKTVDGLVPVSSIGFPSN
jgi:hypothetical protein